MSTDTNRFDDSIRLEQFQFCQRLLIGYDDHSIYEVMMRRRFMSFVILVAATSCSASTGISQSVPPATLVPESATVATFTATNVPAVPNSTTVGTNPTATAPLTPTPFAQATSILLLPTTPSKISVPPTAPSTSGWKTFAGTKFQVALDYPPDWTVREDAAGVTFISPQGVMVNLARVETGNVQPETFLNQTDLPNMHCLPSVNAHGLNVRNCFDTIASAYIANIIVKSPGGQEELLTLTTRSRGTPEVFNSMVASVRSVR